MRLIVYNSNSSGNAYLLDNGREALLLECGLPINRITQRMGTGIARCVGCLVSHEHKDHARSAEDVAQRRVPVYMSQGTGEALFGDRMPANVYCLEPMKEVQIGGFYVTPIPVQHDAAEPFGYLIKHYDCGSVLFATDTSYLKHRFRGLNQLMIECNYCEDVLEENCYSGLINYALKERTIRSHMSLTTTQEVVQANDGPGLRNVILLHLSESNSDQERMRETIEAVTRAKVSVARPFMEVELKKTPF